MADIQKPDMSSVWASGGAILTPSTAKIETGWTAEIPPHQWENYVQNRQDNAIAYLFQKGIPEWDATTEYQANKSFVQYAGVIYKAKTLNTNKQPDTNPSDWGNLNSILGLGTAATKDVTVSTTDTTAGRILKVGDFGVGLGGTGQIYIDNVDRIDIPTGFYRVNNVTTGTFPANSGNHYGTLIVEAYNLTSGAESFCQTFTRALNTPHRWFRYYAYNLLSGSPGWSDWVEIYHSGNLTQATETAAGLLEIATTAEAQALADDTTALTPKKLADAFKGANQSLVTNGYQILPGGLIIQWGEVSQSSGAEGSTSITFPVAFPNACLQVIPGLDVGTWSPATGFNVSAQTLGKTASGFTLYLQMSGGITGSGTYKLTYIAIGY